MAIRAVIEGNLTKNPESRVVKVKGEDRALVEVRVFCDVSKLVGDTWVQDEDRSTGVDVTIWGERLGEEVMRLMRKGARVSIEGDLWLNRYKDQETGEPHAGLRMNAEKFTLMLFRIQSLGFAPKRGSDPIDGQPGLG